MYQRFVLDNGIRVFVNELPHTRSATVSVYVRTGSRYEPNRIAGISHFIEHMLFKGTEKRPAAQDIATAIEGIGGAFNASTGHEYTNYWVKVTFQHFDVALDVLSDMLRYSLLAPAEIEKERRVIIEEIMQTFDTPDELVFFDLDALMWPAHPLGRDIAGTPESVAGLTRRQMCDYMGQHYYAGNVVISAAGLMQTDVVLPRIADAFKDLPAGKSPGYRGFKVSQRTPRWNLRYKKTEQAHVAVSTWSYPRLHPDRFVINVLHGILGDGMSSRLFQEIREKQGLAYSVSSFGGAHDDCGHFGSYAAVEPKKAAIALKAMLGEWARLREEPVAADELSKAKELIKGHFLLSMEDTHSIAGWYGRQEIMGHEILTVDQVSAAIDAVTTEDVQRVSRDLFRKNWLNLSVVGPFRGDGPFAQALDL
ncbi:MAG: pitrilysin family protein [Anaerolineae bacterium]